MKPKRKDSPITTGSFLLFVRHVPTRSPIGDMASSAPSVKSIIPASKRTAPKRKQSRMLEEMGAITKQSTSTIAMIGSTACSASFHFSAVFLSFPIFHSPVFLRRTFPFSQNPPVTWFLSTFVFSPPGISRTGDAVTGYAGFQRHDPVTGELCLV